MFGTSTGGRLTRRTGLALLAAAVTVGAAVVVTSATADAKSPSHLPYGHINSIKQVSARTFQLSGWAVDNDSNSALKVSLTINGKRRAVTTANRTSPRVPANRGNHGSRHGFVVNVRAPLGTDRICVVAANRGRGHAKQIGCRTRTMANNPEGALTSVTQVVGGIRFVGAAWDPNSSKPINVAVTANGKRIATLPANRGKHRRSFNGTAAMAQGTYQVCATGQNIGWGTNTQFACRTITVNYGPTGAITSLRQVPGGVQLTGWSTDPDTAAPIQVQVLDGATVLGSATADQPGTVKNGHEFAAQYKLAQGTHTVCVRGINVGPGQNQNVACRTIALNFNPTARVTGLTQSPDGVRAVGTAIDPDTSGSIDVLLSLDGQAPATAAADRGSKAHSFNEVLPADAGKHVVCAVAVNVAFGTGNSPQACQTITLNYNPIMQFENLVRAGSNPDQLIVSGWALNPGSTAPGGVQVAANLDGKPATSDTADEPGADVPAGYAGTYGTTHGFSFTVPADDGEHTVCLVATNSAVGNGAGAQSKQVCQLIVAVNPVAPSAPQKVTAVGGYGGATVNWAAPATDGGAPPSSYTVVSSPGGVKASVGGTATSATVMGLKPTKSYTFTVVATNVAGTSRAATSPAVKTQTAPPPQTSPAPVSTSRYIRNISSGSASELATMRNEGAADAYYNPSGHGYLVLLDIGGQDNYDGGVVLSATTRFVSYGALVKSVEAYVDGYASKQRASAPVTIAIGTNNDMDVTKPAGQAWADKVVDPIAGYVAGRYPGITVAGANDIEPGFRGSYTQSKAWLTGYLAATRAPFVFNGSADGCSWSATNRHCNNGWTMAGLYQLAGGVAPARIVNLPQIYNTTMPKQWKYISLTGVNAGQPRINFGGPLTEWTACDQAGGCGSITGNSAWQQLWNQLQSTAQLKVASLPYATDLRIDR